MSNKLINMAYKMPTNTVETFVLVTLADYADDNGYCYPSYVKLMEITKLSRSALAKTLAILEGAGFFEKQAHSSVGHGNKVNTYQLSFDDSWFQKIEQIPSISMRRQLIESMRIELISKINSLREKRKRPISCNLKPDRCLPLLLLLHWHQYRAPKTL